MKKILPVILISIIITVIISPLGSAFAYAGGLLDGRTMIYSNNLTSGSGTNAVTDRNISTGVNLYGHSKGAAYSKYYVWYEFDAPSYIESYMLYRVGNNPNVRFYDENGTLLKSVTGVHNVKTVVDVANVKKVALYWAGSSTAEIREFDVFGPPIIEDLKNLLLNSNYNNVSLSWTTPSTNPNFTGTKIYRDGVELTTVDKNVNTFIDNDILPNTIYSYKVTAIYFDGQETEGLTKTITTPLKPKIEVKNLEVETFHNRVNFDWVLPEYEGFHHVNIYRKQVEAQSFYQMLFSGTSVSAAETSDGFTPMFETNETYWNDLTVEPETTYEYKLTTESTTGDESEGQIVEVTTLEEPLPEMGGEEVNTDENGDYKVTWTSPTEGQVKILIDGNEYAVVDASVGQYVIPADDMKYDLFGKPKVQLVAISASGKEGEATKPPVNGENPGSIGVTMPITVTEFLKTVLSLIAWIGPFILLALAIRLAPRIVAYLKGVLAKYKEGRLRL